MLIEQPPPAPVAPRPAPELDALKFLVGTWRCDGRIGATPMGPEHAFKATAKTTRDLDGFWYTIRYSEKKAKDHPFPVTAVLAWGYDPVGKAWVGTGIDSFGGWGATTAKGFEGDKLVFTGEEMLMGKKTPLRETLTRKSDKEVSMLREVSMEKGKWMMLQDMTCKK